MRTAIFIAAVGLVAIWAYDELAFKYAASSGTVPRFIWGDLVKGPEQYVPEYFLPVMGAGLITYLAVSA